MGRYSSETQRPPEFTLNPNSQLAQGLGVAGLGRLKGSTRYQDSSAFGNHGMLTNMDPATDWVWSNTLSRNCVVCAQSDLVTVPYRSMLFPGLTFSFAVWINSSITDYTSSGYIIGQYTTAGDNRQWALRINSTGDVFGIVVSATGTSTATSTDTSQAVQTGWNHVAFNVTWTDANSNSYWDFYYDGVYKQQLTVTKGFVNRSTSLDIGGITGNANSFLGGVADPLYYPQRRLTAEEIRQLADQSNVMLSGLIQPPQRKWWPVVSSVSTIPIPVFMNQYRQRVA